MNTPECNICHIELDEEEHQPLHLGCSHDACRACVKGLINNGSLMCPMCRTVVVANAPDDLKINHGVVQILRMFKEFKVSENHIRKEEVSVRNTEICRIHKHSLDMRCVSCKLWICMQCKETHTSEIGCEVQDYNAYLNKLKKEHIQSTEPTVVSMKVNLKSYSSVISQIEKEISQIECEKKKLEEKHKNILKLFEEGSMTLNEVQTATAEVEKASTVIELNQKVNISNEFKHFARIWCMKNPGSYLEVLRSGVVAYATMDINTKSFSSKLLLENGKLYLHCFKENESNLNKSSIVYPYNKVMPSIRELVFLDLAIAGTVEGRVTIRLRQDLPNYAKYIPLLFTGEERQSVIDLVCTDGSDFNLGMNVCYATRAIKKFKRDANAGYEVTQGSVLAYWSGNDFTHIFIYLEQGTQPYSGGYQVFGQVESGLDIVKLCRKHHTLSQVTVKDCGLVLKEDTLDCNPVTY